MRRAWVKVAILVGTLGLTLSLHYMVFPMPHVVHLMHRRLCYVPIILGALWFGLRGGVLTASAISLAVLPLALRDPTPALGNEEYLEMAFYLALGLLAGALVDARERERDGRERLQRELAESDRLAALGRAAAGIAHEVRTPLGSIQGAAEILAEDYPEGHPRRPYLGILLEECRRMGRVVEDFLSLGRPVVLHRSEVDLAAASREVTGALAAEARERGVALEVEAPGEPLLLEADPDRLRQVLVNLASNALAVSPRGAGVSLRVVRAGAEARLEVLDRGPGVPEEQRERIFEPFYSRRPDGTGLGLAVARLVARAHGGDLRCEPRAGGGSRFVLRLPAASGVAP